MTYLIHLKKAIISEDCRWVVKRNSQEVITEVKLVYQPSEYEGRDLLNHSGLIQVLEDEKDKK